MNPTSASSGRPSRKAFSPARNCVSMFPTAELESTSSITRAGLVLRVGCAVIGVAAKHATSAHDKPSPVLIRPLREDGVYTGFVTDLGLGLGLLLRGFRRTVAPRPKAKAPWS